MSVPEELRQRAEALLTMALKAREQGQFANAESLLAEAAQFISEADELEAQARSARQAQEPQPVRRTDKPD
jgi:cellobiose-specific phosphotransferase system component IIA